MLISVRDNKYGKNIRQIYVLRNTSSTSDTLWLNKGYYRVANVTITFNRETVSNRDGRRNMYINTVSKLKTQPICVVNVTEDGGMDYDDEGLLFKNLIICHLQLAKAKK